MIRHVNRLFVILLAVAAALYVVVLNRADVTIFLRPGSAWTASGGVILLAAFVAGVLAATAVGIFFGVKAWFREQRLWSHERARQAFLEGVVRARSAGAAGKHTEAIDLWERLSKRDPTDIISRIELSRAYQESGDLKLALKVIDQARVAAPDNLEVLFRAAEVNTLLGNRTAAIDNLTLVLGKGKNRAAAEMARNLSEEIGRFEDAKEFHHRLQGEIDSKEFGAIEARITYGSLMAQTQGDPEKTVEALVPFVKRNPDCIPAVERLAELYIQGGKRDEAAQLLVRAARAKGETSLWQRAQRLWVEDKMPEKAVSSAKSARTNTSGLPRIQAEMELIKTYLGLNMLHEAKAALDGLPSLLKEQGVPLAGDIALRATILKGIYYFRSGDVREAASLWKELLERELELVASRRDTPFLLGGHAPEPHLSTP